ncbi:MAG: MauE/DoxX family redox-associated membrane protein [Streptosporangiaceae bacterium]|jgi:hypothetical protein|nr:hypothetical protein [Actinomycetota bacterium]
MTIISAIQYVQIPLLAAMLLGGCSAKLVQAVRGGSMEATLGPTALFPMRMRRPLALALCAVECVLGIGLIATAGQAGRGAPAMCVRLGAVLLFTVATSALIELRTSRPDIGCGCFGEFSGTPVTGRSLARSALLAVAALVTVWLPPLRQAAIESHAAQLLIILVAELTVIGALSPEVGEGLVRLGYSDPCELRLIPAARTLAALRRSKQWRRHAGVVTAGTPSDIWRELCWRYVVYPSRVDGRDAQIVFAVYLKQRRPPIHVALVDAASGRVLPWPAAPPRPGRPGRPTPHARRGRALRVPVAWPGLATARRTSAHSHLPFSTDL